MEAVNQSLKPGDIVKYREHHVIYLITSVHNGAVDMLFSTGFVLNYNYPDVLRKL